jgi:hypothetical protein
MFSIRSGRADWVRCALTAALGIGLIMPIPARAETSWHKLGRKLHKLEKKTGNGLWATGDALIRATPMVLGFAAAVAGAAADDDVDIPSGGKSSGSAPKVATPENVKPKPRD